MSIEATVVYAIDTGDKPVVATTGPGGRGRDRWGGQDDPRPVTIEDLRPRAASLSLDREGFVLVRSPTAAGLWDEAQRRDVYDREIERLIAEQTGARRVVVFDHTLRSGDPDKHTSHFAREPVYLVHNDYTPRSAPWRVEDALPDEAADLLSRRFAIVQVWRPIGRPVLRDPLALCDAATVAPEDLIAAERRHPNRVGEIFHVRHSPAHRWWYAPALEPDEALVFKVYDSATDGRACHGAHTSFVDPTVPPNAPPRESIEVRALAFF